MPAAKPPKFEKEVAEFEETVLSRPRLSILAALIGGDEVDFTFLQKNLGISDGNLSTHLHKLVAGKYVRSHRVLTGSKPKTWFSITPEGRRALERLFRQLETLLTQTPRPGAR